MSLVEWLPLNGDLKNQGLNDVTISGSGAYTSNTAGKIGNCILTSTSNKIDLGYNGAQINTGSISMCGWFKLNQAAIEAKLSTLTYPTTAPSATGSLIGNGSYGGIGLVWTANKTTASDPLTSIKVYLYIRSSTNGALASSQYTIPFDTWVHIAGTFDKDTKRGSLYINGSLFAGFNNNAFTDAPSRNLYINYNGVMAGNGPGSYIPFYCNDVRIYDNCLSPMEVHEIAQAKLIHLKLSDPYMEATTNLATSNLSNTCYNGATNKYGYGTNTDMYKDDGYYQGRNCTRVRMGTNGLDAYPYVYFDAFATSGATTYTLSFDYFPTIGDVIGPYSLNGASNWSWSTDDASGSETNVAFLTPIPVKLYQWNHIRITARKYDTSSTARGTGYLRIGSAKHTSNTLNYWLFANVQVEAKDHETGWTALNTTRSAESIGDASGYGHAGTPNNIVVSKDSVMYNISSKFNGSSSYVKVDDNTWMADGMSAFTVNLWAKSDSAWATNTHFFSCTESGGFNTEAGNSGYLRFPHYVYTNSAHTSYNYQYDSNELKLADLPVGSWVMLTWVYDSTGTRTYINGQLHHTYTATSYGMRFNTNARLFLGCEANTANPTPPYFNGQMSDFRMYASALTADDIQSLYSKRGYIDNLGNVYIGEAIEL